MTILSDRHVAPDHTTRKIRTAASVLSALLSMLLSVAALAACAPLTPARIAPTATTQATATATAVPRLVYQADWSHGLAGWAPTRGWTVSGAVLRSDTGNDRQITLPFRPLTPNYAVEFRLRIVSLAPGAGTQYALRVDPAAGVDGFVALVEHVTVPGTRLFPDHPHEMIYIDPMTDQEDFGAHTLFGLDTLANRAVEMYGTSAIPRSLVSPLYFLQSVKRSAHWRDAGGLYVGATTVREKQHGWHASQQSGGSADRAT